MAGLCGRGSPLDDGGMDAGIGGLLITLGDAVQRADGGDPRQLFSQAATRAAALLFERAAGIVQASPNGLAARSVGVTARFHGARIRVTAQHGYVAPLGDVDRLTACVRILGSLRSSTPGFLDGVDALLGWVGDQLDRRNAAVVTHAVFASALECLRDLALTDLLAGRDDISYVAAFGHLARARLLPDEAAVHNRVAVTLFERLADPAQFDLPPAVAEHLSVLAGARVAGKLPPADLADLSTASRRVAAARLALDARGGPDATTVLLTALLSRYRITGADQDVAEAATRARVLGRQLGTVDPQVDAPLVLAAGNALAAYALTADDGDQARAAALLLRPLLADVEPERREHAAVAMAAACDVLCRFDPAAAREILEEALRRVRWHVGTWATLRSALATAWYAEWERTRSVGALDEAIVIVWELVHGEDAPPTHEEHERLAHWLLERHEARGRVRDLRDSALLFLEIARHPDATPLLLSNAAMLGITSGVLQRREHLEMAVGVLTALAGADDVTGEPSRARRFANLAHGALHLHEVSDDAGHLRLAVDAANHAERLGGEREARFLTATARFVATLRLGAYTGIDDASRHLAGARAVAVTASEKQEIARLEMTALWVLTRSGATSDRDRERAATQARAIAEDPENLPGLRRGAARFWADHSEALGRHAEAAAAYRLLLSLIPDAAWQASGTQDRRAATGTFRAAVNDGAAHALLAASPLAALAALEFGRTRTRRPRASIDRSLFDDLRRALPQRHDHIDRLEHGLVGLERLENAEGFWDYLEGVIGAELALPAFVERSLDGDLGEYLGPDGFDRAKRTSARMNARVTSHPEELRAQFLAELEVLADEAGLPTSPDMNDTAAADLVAGLQGSIGTGFVVVVNISRIACHAVVVSATELSVLRLADLSATGVVDIARELQSAVLRLEANDADRTDLDTAVTTCLDHLWHGLAVPVLAELQRLGAPARPRIWWYLPGVLSALPVHAAQRAAHAEDSLLHHAVSSYTASLTTLRTLLNRTPHTGSVASALILPAAGTPGSLPGADREVGAVVDGLRALGRSPTVAGNELAVIADEIARCSWMHACCHGLPSLSGTSPAGLATIGGFLTSTRLNWTGHAEREFAYLSSCHSALSLSDDPNECEHLAAELQDSGFREVIATLWAANDRIAERIATEVYGRLVATPGTTPDGARALNEAVRAVMHRYPVALWAPFVHFGV